MFHDSKNRRRRSRRRWKRRRRRSCPLPCTQQYYTARGGDFFAVWVFPGIKKKKKEVPRGRRIAYSRITPGFTQPFLKGKVSQNSGGPGSPEVYIKFHVQRALLHYNLGVPLCSDSYPLWPLGWYVCSRFKRHDSFIITALGNTLHLKKIFTLSQVRYSEEREKKFSSMSLDFYLANFFFFFFF